MTSEQLECALDLMRRMPPTMIDDNIDNLLDLVPDLTEDLLLAIDAPLQVAQDAKAGKNYLLCDYNRDGDSYRSPWTNSYDPPLSDGSVPSSSLRKQEVLANDMFDYFRDRYYEGGSSSVYMWEIDSGFAACILLKKQSDKAKRNPVKGCWDSIHVVEVEELTNKKASYKLTSTIMLFMETKSSTIGTVNLSGSLTRQMRQESRFDKNTPHVVNIGKMIENLENRLREYIYKIYFGKTQDIIGLLHSLQTLSEFRKQDAIRRGLAKDYSAGAPGSSVKRKGRS